MRVHSGLRLVSLQKGDGQEQWELIAGKWPTIDLSDHTQELSGPWKDAALINALDLVITVDTALAFSTWGYALARMDAGRLGVSTYVVPPITVVFSRSKLFRSATIAPG